MFDGKLNIILIIAIIVVAVFAVFLIILLSLLHHKKRIKDKVQKLCDAFDLYNSQLVTACYDMLLRIKSLSQYSRSYELKYSENQKKYDELLNKKAVYIKGLTDNLKALLVAKKKLLNLVLLLEFLMLTCNKHYKKIEKQEKPV